MAIAILGGLTTATFLNLVVLPETLIRLQHVLGLAEPQLERPSQNRTRAAVQ
jgi:hypothetical protein